MDNNTAIEELTKLLSDARLDYIEASNNIREEYEQRSNNIERQIERLRQQQQRKPQDTQARRRRHGNNRNNDTISIGDIVEIRNRYKDRHGVSAFGIRGKVTAVDRSFIVLRNEKTGRIYKRARQNLRKIPPSETEDTTE